jgi:hypothetical protein
MDTPAVLAALGRADAASTARPLFASSVRPSGNYEAQRRVGVTIRTDNIVLHGQKQPSTSCFICSIEGHKACSCRFASVDEGRSYRITYCGDEVAAVRCYNLQQSTMDIDRKIAATFMQAVPRVRTLCEQYALGQEHGREPSAEPRLAHMVYPPEQPIPGMVEDLSAIDSEGEAETTADSVEDLIDSIVDETPQRAVLYPTSRGQPLLTQVSSPGIRLSPTPTQRRRSSTVRRGTPARPDPNPRPTRAHRTEATVDEIDGELENLKREMSYLSKMRAIKKKTEVAMAELQKQYQRGTARD